MKTDDMTSKFPCELMEKIFAFLTQKRDHAQCLQVCKAWHYPAREQLFEHVTILSVMRCNQFLDLITKNKKADKDLAALVKYITIDIPNRNNKNRSLMSLANLVSLFCRCSNIVRLEFSGRTDPFYLLRSVASNKESFLEKIIGIELSNSKRHSPSTKSHYMLAALTHKKIIQSLTVYGDVKSLNFEGGLIPQNKYISLFVNLGSLVLEFEHASIIDLHDILQSVPRLKKLQINAPDMGKFTSNYIAGFKNMSSDRGHSTIINEPECCGLTHMNLRGRSVDLNALEYIVENCPNLKQFQMSLLFRLPTIACRNGRKRHKLQLFFDQFTLKGISLINITENNQLQYHAPYKRALNTIQ